MPDTTIIKNCRNCGLAFSITPKQQEGFKEKDMNEPSRCPSCRAKNRLFTHKACKDCNEIFGISELEKEWFAKKGFEEPERCLECRKKRREAQKNV